jgi:putative membrane protein
MLCKDNNREKAMKRRPTVIAATLMACGIAGAQEVTKPAEFAKMAAASNMFEIQSSKLALTRSTDEATKTFAEHMIADHTKAGQEMMPAAKADKIKIPEKLDQKHQAKLDALKSADKSTFDKMYQAEQLKAHEAAVALFTEYAKNGEKGELKTFAVKTLPTLEEHLAEVQKMKVAL